MINPNKLIIFILLLVTCQRVTCNKNFLFKFDPSIFVLFFFFFEIVISFAFVNFFLFFIFFTSGLCHIYILE